MRPRLDIAALAALAASACNATYSPPVRTFHYGAPARMTAERIEAGVAGGGLITPFALGPHLGVGLTDWAAVELGGSFAIGLFYMAWAGCRFSYASRRDDRFRFIGDVELGGGAGVGGEASGRVTFGHPTLGAYHGLGVGFGVDWFSMFLRARVEASDSQDPRIPPTLWPSASLGFEATIARRVAITVTGGYLGYANRVETRHGWFYQLGITVYFGGAERPAATSLPASPL